MWQSFSAVTMLSVYPAPEKPDSIIPKSFLNYRTRFNQSTTPERKMAEQQVRVQWRKK